MCTIFRNLSYRDALNKAKISTLSERREVLSLKLFEDIVGDIVAALLLPNIVAA